jgi:hypothetical protein
VGAAQGLTGALIGTVQDEQGGVLVGARVRISSPAMIGGPVTVITKADGQLYFSSLSPGVYNLDVEFKGFAAFHQEDIVVRAGATIDRPVILALEGLKIPVVVKGTGLLDPRASGLGTHFGPEDLAAIPTRRTGQIDYIRAAPGISPTSPAGGVTSTGVPTTFSSFGSGTNENQFLFDGTNFTCPCNGMARADPGVDFIREVHVQSIGASAEYGNVQGAVVNVILKQGSNRLLFDAAYYVQTRGLTSQPVRLQIPNSTLESGYHRSRYRDVTSSLGGPVVRDHLWFFGAYQSLRDSDSQPGTLTEVPRTFDQDKVFGKLTWKLAPGWQLNQSIHDEFQVIRDQPTIILKPEATLHHKASVPAVIFGNLTHTGSANTVWDLHVGRFVFSQDNTPSTGDRKSANRVESTTGVSSGAPPQFTILTISRTTAKATVSHYMVGFLGADHELKVGGQVEQAGHHAITVIPTGARFTDTRGLPNQRVSADPSHVVGRADTASAFASDALRLGSRLTINAGLRFDHSRAISQDLSAVDLEGRETSAVVHGLGTLYTWNVWSPRLGVATKLSADGRTMLRASYGRFSQGVLTGELEPFHPGATTQTTEAFESATADYTRLVLRVDPKELRLNPKMRAPHTDEFSVGVDREVSRQLALTIAYVRKEGRDFIGWQDVGGRYAETPALLADGRTMTVFKLVNQPSDRRYYLTNPEGYSLSYNGLVAVAEKRRSHGWQASGSYTFSKTYGLQASSGGTAAGAQASTVSPPQLLTFGRDPNDLINARGRMLNDRPHMFRVTGSVDVPRTRFVFAASLQAFSGKPWAATALINPQSSTQRVLIEPRGSRRLSSQTLLDLRVSRTIALGRMGQAELLLDVLNALNDTAEESIASDVLVNSTFGRGTTFMDPRRAMLSVRFHLGR